MSNVIAYRCDARSPRKRRHPARHQCLSTASNNGGKGTGLAQLRTRHPLPIIGGHPATMPRQVPNEARPV